MSSLLQIRRVEEALELVTLTTSGCSLRGNYHAGPFCLLLAAVLGLCLLFHWPGSWELRACYYTAAGALCSHPHLWSVWGAGVLGALSYSLEHLQVLGAFLVVVLFFKDLLIFYVH